MTLREILGAGYAAQVMGRGTLPNAIMKFRGAVAEHPGLLGEAKAELARCDKLIGHRSGKSCQIEIQNANFLRAALAQTEVTNG